MTKAMEMERRRREKEQMVSSWEEIFKVEVNKVLSPISLKVLWDDDTSCSEACALLTVAAIVSGPTPSEEPKKANIRVVDSTTNTLLSPSFTTKREAEEYVLECVKSTSHKMDDFMIVQVL